MSAAATNYRSFRLADLARSPYNVRKKQDLPPATKGKNKDGEAAVAANEGMYFSPGIIALAALILSQGLLQNLVGHLEMKGKKETGRGLIVAGGRRLQALLYLLSTGQITADYQVTVLVVSEEDAIANSLAENSGREDMHPADEAEAFGELLAKGRTPEQIASDWGRPLLMVQRRLKLAKLAPSLVELFRNGDLSLEQATVLVLVEDHAKQEGAWKGCASHARTPYYLKKVLLGEREPIEGNRLVKYVTLKAYEAAGGEVVRDLFSSDGKGGYIGDAALLRELAEKKLEAKAEKMRKSLPWVIASVDDLDYNFFRQFGQVGDIRKDPTKKQAEKLAAAQSAHDEADRRSDALNDELATLDEDSAEYETKGAEVKTLYAEIRKQKNIIDDINKGLTIEDPIQREHAGAVIWLNWNGAVETRDNLIRPEDADKHHPENLQAKKSGASLANGLSGKQKLDYSEKLNAQLTAHRTAAIQARIADRPDVALVVLVHTLCRTVFGLHRWDYPSCSEISIQIPNLKGAAGDMTESRAWKELTEKEAYWLERLPLKADKAEQLFSALLEMDKAELERLMAFCVAQSVSTIERRPEKLESKLCSLAQAVELDMADYWEPTADSYFGHISKPQIIEAVSTVLPMEKTVDLVKLKKGELAKFAEESMRQSRWTPKIFKVGATAAAKGAGPAAVASE